MTYKNILNDKQTKIKIKIAYDKIHCHQMLKGHQVILSQGLCWADFAPIHAYSLGDGRHFFQRLLKGWRDSSVGNLTYYKAWEFLEPTGQKEVRAVLWPPHMLALAEVLIWLYSFWTWHIWTSSAYDVKLLNIKHIQGDSPKHQNKKAKPQKSICWKLKFFLFFSKSHTLLQFKTNRKKKPCVFWLLSRSPLEYLWLKCQKALIELFHKSAVNHVFFAFDFY